MDANGKLSTHTDDNLVIGINGVADGYNKLGFTFAQANAISITRISSYDRGDKMVLNFQSMDDHDL